MCIFKENKCQSLLVKFFSIAAEPKGVAAPQISSTGEEGLEIIPLDRVLHLQVAVTGGHHPLQVAVTGGHLHLQVAVTRGHHPLQEAIIRSPLHLQVAVTGQVVFSASR